MPLVQMQEEEVINEQVWLVWLAKLVINNNLLFVTASASICNPNWHRFSYCQCPTVCDELLGLVLDALTTSPVEWSLEAREVSR